MPDVARGGLVPLPPTTPSLGRILPRWGDRRFADGTLFVLGPDGGYAALPHDGQVVEFGRSKACHVRIGRGDDRVSRLQGRIRRRDGTWWLTNLGSVPLRVPDIGPPLLTGHEVALPTRYTTAFVAGRRPHVLELSVGVTERRSGHVGDEDRTAAVHCWSLAPRDRLVLTVVFEAYLSRVEDPRPATSGEAADRLIELTGDRAWNAHRVANVVDAVRAELAGRGETGLTRDEAPADKLRENLYRALAIESATLTPRDLDLLSEAAE